MKRYRRHDLQNRSINPAFLRPVGPSLIREILCRLLLLVDDRAKLKTGFIRVIALDLFSVLIFRYTPHST